MDEQEEGEAVQLQQPKRTGWRRFIYLEPMVVLYSIGDFLNYALLQQYVYYRVADEMGLPVDFMMEESGGCGSITDGGNNTFVDIEMKVQAKVAMVNLLISLSIQIPSILVSLLFGAWTDKNGRRPALFSPVIGTLGFSLIWLLVMYLDVSVYGLCFASLFSGCSGYIATMQQTATTYIVDITSESNRIFRVAVLEFLVLMTGVVCFMISGWGIEVFGYKLLVWFTLSSEVVCLLYFFILPESRPKAPDAPRFFSGESFKSMWCVLRKHRSDGGRKILSLLLACICLGFMCSVGIDGVITLLYLASPLCLSSVLIGYMYSYWIFAVAAGGVVLTSKPLLRRLGEFKLVVIGIIAVSLALVWLAFCDRRWMIYTGPIIWIPTGVLSPVLKGWLSKIVSADEQGAIFAVASTLETAGGAVGLLMLNPIYAALAEFHHSSLTFLIPAGIAVIPLIILCCIHKEISVVEQKQETEVKM